MSDGREAIYVVEDDGKMMKRENSQMKLCTAAPKYSSLN